MFSNKKQILQNLATPGLPSWFCSTKTSRSLHFVAVHYCFCYFGSPFAVLTSALRKIAPSREKVRGMRTLQHRNNWRTQNLRELSLMRMCQREFFFFGSFFLFASLICFTPSSHSLCFPLRGKRSLVISALLRVFTHSVRFALRKFASEQKEKMNKKIFPTSVFQNKQGKKYFVFKKYLGRNSGTYIWKIPIFFKGFSETYRVSRFVRHCLTYGGILIICQTVKEPRHRCERRQG